VILNCCGNYRIDPPLTRSVLKGGGTEKAKPFWWVVKD